MDDPLENVKQADNVLDLWLAAVNDTETARTSICYSLKWTCSREFFKSLSKICTCISLRVNSISWRIMEVYMFNMQY